LFLDVRLRGFEPVTNAPQDTTDDKRGKWAGAALSV